MREKADRGRFFEDFRLGEELIHATPRSVTQGDAALYLGLYGSRFVVNSSEAVARRLGFAAVPLDDFLVFHLVFGRTVPDVSRNGVSNLGYAEGRFGVPVYPGDTLSATSRVIGLRQNRSGETGIVYVRSRGVNQRGDPVVEFSRWVMVRKRDRDAPAPETVVPELDEAVAVENLVMPEGLVAADYDTRLSGSAHLWEDYEPGERLDHVDGVTVEESDQAMVTRLYQNNAPVHLNAHMMEASRFGRRIAMAGHVISIARTLSFNGLGNAFRVAAINGGRHVAPVFAGDTLYAWSEVLEKSPLPARDDLGALRLRTVAVKDRDCADFPLRTPDGDLDPAVVLELDYTVLLPRRAEPDRRSR